MKIRNIILFMMVIIMFIVVITLFQVSEGTSVGEEVVTCNHQNWDGPFTLLATCKQWGQKIYKCKVPRM